VFRRGGGGSRIRVRGFCGAVVGGKVSERLRGRCEGLMQRRGGRYLRIVNKFMKICVIIISRLRACVCWDGDD
jgi:hypothetical protein